MSKFKVGDRVQLVGYTGYTGVVLCASTREGLVEVIMGRSGILYYPPESLELITTEATSSVKKCGNYLEIVNESDVKQEDYSYYKYSYKGIKLDPYRILDIYKITCPAQQHAIKKLLRAGNSVKELKQDIAEVIDTLKRKLEMLEEDSDNP